MPASASLRDASRSGLMPPPPPRTCASEDGVHSRASDTGSVESEPQGSVKSQPRSASDAGSMSDTGTSMSAGTMASGASTAFYSEKVHVFSLGEFAGHEIATILEDGEHDENELVRAPLFCFPASHGRRHASTCTYSPSPPARLAGRP